MSNPTRSDDARWRRLALLRDQPGSVAASGETGHCRIEWDGGVDEVPRVTRDQCREAALDLGGTYTWQPGDTPKEEAGRAVVAVDAGSGPGDRSHSITPLPVQGDAGPAEVPSASLLTRLGEAADGFRDGKDVWVVAKPEFPHESKAFREETLAREYAEAKGFRVFGPFRTRNVPPSMLAPALGVKAQVVEVAVRVRLPDGTEETHSYAGNECDAIFWSESALDKFVLPYYVGVANLDFGMQVRAEFLHPDACFGAHLPDTTWSRVEIGKQKKRKDLPGDGNMSQPAEGPSSGEKWGLTFTALRP